MPKVKGPIHVTHTAPASALDKIDSPIDRMIKSHVSCTICGKAGYMTCDCWTKCRCGWVFEKGTECRNPDCK